MDSCCSPFVMNLVHLQYWPRVSPAGHHRVCLCVCVAQEQVFEVLWSSCKSKAVFPMRVPDQRFQGAPANIHNRIASHGDTPCLQEELGSVLAVLCSLCCCHHPGLNLLLFLVRKGISVPRYSLVLEAGEALTSLDCFLELAGAHLRQHHPPSFCAACAGVAVSIFLLCCIILSLQLPAESPLLPLLFLPAF